MVMTNYHVVRDPDNRPEDPIGARIRFFFDIAEDAIAATEGLNVVERQLEGVPIYYSPNGTCVETECVTPQE